MLKWFFTSMLVVIVLVITVSMAADEDPPRLLPIDTELSLQTPDSRAACTMFLHNGIAAGWMPTFEAGWGIYTYFDPSVQCGSPTYPFEISAISFSLFDPGGYSWPAHLDVVVYDTSSGNICDGPGPELCRFSIVADQATYRHPNIGTFTFPGLCCVSGPVIVGLEYTAGTNANTPSIQFDDEYPVDTCYHWVDPGDGLFHEFRAYFGNLISHPVFWVHGETASALCGGPQCSWEPGDYHKMHYPQLPNETGWDVAANPGMETADDWQCSETGSITDIHFWGGWKNDLPGIIDSFACRIYEDIPANPPDVPFSHPGEKLWELYVPIGEIDVVEIIPGTNEGWWNPVNGARIENSAQTYYQYNFCIPEGQWFHQDSGVVFWLSITPFIAPGPQTYEWGWKSTTDHFNDNAVYYPGDGGDWIPIWEPDEILGNYFELVFDENGDFVSGVSENSYGNGWYFYPQTEWWNVWFYDHPFDPRRMKALELLIDQAFPYSGFADSYVDVAINWSTDQWSLDQPSTDSFPPLPGEDEALYIARSMVYQGHPAGIPLPAVYTDTVPFYNPEWVSVDIRGYNFVLTGIMSHECRGPMDLAFVITGEPDPVQRCCLPDGDCQMLTLEDCIQLGGTTYYGECVTPQACCLPDTSCAMLDPVCCADLGGTPLGEGVQCSQYTRACCFPDGSCEGYMDSLCCLEIGGTPSEFINCAGDLNQNGINDNCEPEWTACCLPDGSCDWHYLNDCADLGGISIGWRDLCWGDNNADGVDDRCEDPWQPGDEYKMHFPQLPDPGGWAVNAQGPILADDWECTESGYVNNLHFWGAFKDGAHHPVDIFELRIFEDIPADQSPTEYSMPGALLWEHLVFYGGYTETRMTTPPQGWYNPETQEVFPDDHQEMIQYDIYFPDSIAFVQDSGTIYWLGIRAMTPAPPPFGWGWKSSQEHWNDDAVWGFYSPPSWTELYEPTAFTVSMDMAFVITGKESPAVPCMPGDANGDDGWNVADATYVINYVFKGGPEPWPWPVCNGDANCDCVVNVADAVYCINYIFKGGPPPCSEAEWIANCGPLQK